MKVSVNTLKQFVDFDLTIDELVEKINLQLGGVEAIDNMGERYKDALVVQVVECIKHPNADKLSLCQIDAGTGELIQVVCGADNVRAGMWAVWLPPNSTVPSTFSDDEPFILSAKELRGKVSNGMLASMKELSLGDDHDGIVEITDRDLFEGRELKPGSNFAELFDLNDVIIDIENKMFTHRPDLFGQLGVAREIYGITRSSADAADGFNEPDWYQLNPVFDEVNEISLDVFNDAPQSVPRFMAVALANVSVEKSPLWLSTTLTRWGSKSINTIVDLTNYIMLLTAQPTHAYDYDSLRGGKLGVRMASDGEKLTLLNGKTYTLSNEDIVIVDGEGPVGLAGLMGGGESEVKDTTTRIVLEIATFDMYTVRKSSMRHGIFTDALTRFNKGQSPLQNPTVLQHLMNIYKKFAGATQASPVFDRLVEGATATPVSVHKPIELNVSFVNERLGLTLQRKEITRMLSLVNFNVDDEESTDVMRVCAPFFRTDISLPEDIVEEIGRLYGFNKLPHELPVRSIHPVSSSQAIATKQRIRESLQRFGANEVLTYSFVPEKMIRNARQDPQRAFTVSNALSPDLQYYRLSVLPSLLDKVRQNIKAMHEEFVLFEIGKSHDKELHYADDEGLPSEMQSVDMVYASRKDKPGAAYYRMQAYVEQLLKEFGVSVVTLPMVEDFEHPTAAPFDARRSAVVHDAVTNDFIGIVGELHPEVIRSFKIPPYSAAASIDFGALEQYGSASTPSYVPLSRYPAVAQDVTLIVDSSIYYEDIHSLAQSVLAETLDQNYSWSFEPTAIFRKDQSTTKAITFRLRISHYERTLSDQEVGQLIKTVVASAEDKFDASQG